MMKQLEKQFVDLWIKEDEYMQNIFQWDGQLAITALVWEMQILIKK